MDFDFQSCSKYWGSMLNIRKIQYRIHLVGFCGRRQLEVDFYFQWCLKVLGEVCSAYEKYNILCILGDSEQEATRGGFRLPVLLKSMG